MRDAGVDTQEARLRAAARVVKSNFQFMMYIRITLTLTLAKGVLLSKMYEHVTDVYIDETAIPEQGVFIACHDTDGQIQEPRKKLLGIKNP